MFLAFCSDLKTRNIHRVSNSNGDDVGNGEYGVHDDQHHGCDGGNDDDDDG